MSLDISKLLGVRKLPGKITAQCPVCQEGSRSHLVVFSDGRFGCVIDSSEAHRSAIWQLVGTNSTGEVIQEVLPQIEMEKTWEVELLDRLVKDHTYWNKRGISDATVAPFKGGVATEGQMKSRYVFPIFDSHEQIVGFSGRRVDGKTDMKWKHLNKSSTFVWGGLDDIVERAVLVESIGDSLMLREHGVPESICLFGTNLSQSVLGYLISIGPKQIVISTNNDDHGVGQRAAQKIKNSLDKFFNEDIVSILHPVSAKDWGASSREDIQAAFL